MFRILVSVVRENRVECGMDNGRVFIGNTVNS